MLTVRLGDSPLSSPKKAMSAKELEKQKKKDLKEAKEREKQAAKKERKMKEELAMEQYANKLLLFERDECKVTADHSHCQVPDFQGTARFEKVNPLAGTSRIQSQSRVE
jgi:hypothetical protein